MAAPRARPRRPAYRLRGRRPDHRLRGRRPAHRLRGPRPALPPLEAIALGALHGPAELLPVSSAAHTTIVPWLLGWRCAELEEPVRKAFEVALHVGAAAALAVAARPTGELRLLAAACAPPAAAGWALEGWIERRLAQPQAIAASLVAGSLLMAVGERAPQRRTASQAGVRDGLWLGVAQALALAPGISRRAATEAAARLRGFRRDDAAVLSRQVAAPVIVGAAGLKALRLTRRGLDPPLRLGFAAGAGASFASTLLLAARPNRCTTVRSPLPWAAYRVGLAIAIAARLRRGSKARHRAPARP